MREVLYSHLSTDPFIAETVSDRIYPVNMSDVTPLAPYLVYRFDVSTPRTVPAKNQIIQVWAHDRRGDYGLIDNLLERVKELMSGLKHNEVFAVEWLDDSPDLYDDTSNTITRYSRYQMVRT